MNTIDVVIPTMWKSKNFLSALDTYIKCEYIGNIFLIDNDKANRPTRMNELDSPKLHIICYGKNIYVNPSWNEGYYRSKANVLSIINDDIEVESSVFRDFSAVDFKEIDVVGVHLKNTPDNYTVGVHEGEDELFKLRHDRTQPIGGQGYAFGVCMFIKRTSYKVIPRLYQIWFGDEYLTQNNEHIYIFKTNRIKGEISKTLVSEHKNYDINKRLALDASNAYHFHHIKNARTWDIVKATKERL